MRNILTCLGLFLFVSLTCKAQEQSDDFNQLINWFTGEYTATDQSQNNASQGNFVLHIVRIWPKAPTGAWVYVEESKSDSVDSPFRQEVYFLSEISDGEYSSDVYKIPGDSAFTSAWQNTSKFDGLTAFDLKHQDGCTLFLNYDGFQYSGKTNSGTCKTPAKDSEYTTTDIILLPAEYKVWNRGFDRDDNQISGARKEAIKYIKK